jgi:integrase/recombinase XerD
MKSYLEIEEMQRLEKATTNLRDRLLIRLLSHLGCRISEALTLRVEDIDLGQGLVTIQHLKTRLNLQCPNCHEHLGRKHVFCPGCGERVAVAISKAKEHRRVRTLPLDEDTVSMLKEYIRRDGPVLRQGKRLLFGINLHRAWQVVKECADRADLPKLVNPDTGKLHAVSPHRLRDGFSVHAMKLDDSGDGLRLLQEHLGHSSFNTTARYRKVAGEEHRQWYLKLWGKETNGDAIPQA